MEVLVVVVILGIASVIAVPLISDTTDLQASSAARQIVSTLLFAQTSAIAKQETYQVVFDADAEAYSVQDAAGNVIDDPVIAGKTMEVSYPDSPRLTDVTIETATFNGTDRIWFDRLGAPYSGNPVSNTPMTNGTVTVQAGETAVTVTVEPVTGRISVND